MRDYFCSWSTMQLLSTVNNCGQHLLHHNTSFIAFSTNEQISCSILHLWMLFFAASCFKVKAEKSFIICQIQHWKLKANSIAWKGVWSIQFNSTSMYVYIFSQGNLIASEGAWVCHKNTFPPMIFKRLHIWFSFLDCSYI